MSTLAPRAVLVHRRSELETLVERHGTRGQAEFFLRSRGRDLAAVQDRHDALQEALAVAECGVPAGWRRAAVERADLPRMLFDADDVVLVVGQDGLVANVAKHLAGQPVLGVDPEPGRNPGVLVRNRPADVAERLAALAAGHAHVERRALVEAELDDGQRLAALNELYVGDPGHQSARYRISPGAAGRWEPQSSSGVLAGTGTGATGWCASLARERPDPPRLPGPLEDGLAWFVREAWPSPATGTTLTQGVLAAGEELRLVVESGSLAVFGDGLEADRLLAGWGQLVTVRTSRRHLTLVVPGPAGVRRG